MNHEDTRTRIVSHEDTKTRRDKEGVFSIQGCVFDVYHEMGCGFLEAVSELKNEHKAQLINYLKASGLRLGLLVNFGHHPKTQIERSIL